MSMEDSALDNSETSEVRIGRYRHFKGNEYEVLGIAHDSESMQPYVVYRALYGEGGLWIRPAAMFMEVLERDGSSLPRFTFLGESL